MKKIMVDLEQPKIKKLNAVFHEIISSNDTPADHYQYLNKLFIQTTLPHSDPGDVNFWGRQNGNIALTIQPGVGPGESGKPQSFGLPYGSIPRLLLIWLTSEVVYKKSKHIILGDSLSEFMKQLGIVPTGGRWGSISRLKEQMKRLFSARIATSETKGHNNNLTSLEYAPINIAKMKLWWDPSDPDQKTLWNSHVDLSQEFFEIMQESNVPLDMRVIRALTKSPFDIDLYCWLSHRVHRLPKGRDTFIPWDPLSNQFGSDFKRLVDFKKKFRKKIENILVFKRDIEILEDTKGILIRPTKTQISLSSTNAPKSLVNIQE